MKNRVLAIGAHPDDIEIFMYGILCAYKDLGYEIFSTIVTDGSMGGKIKNLSKVRKQETLNSHNSLNTEPCFLEIPDGTLGDDPFHKQKIKKNIENIRPSIIITHHKKDYHSDHRNLSNIVVNIASHYLPVIFCDTMLGLNFNPKFYLNITKFFNKKINAILCHKSQKPERFVDMVKITNTFRAAQCNCGLNQYAEAYSYSQTFPFTDIRKILPQNMNILSFDINRRFGLL